MLQVKAFELLLRQRLNPDSSLLVKMSVFAEWEEAMTSRNGVR
ncbi:hypothetical protein SynWH8101_1751 [Synechococcus sp. WH 8101]|nr:hypothetical protein SynWH8101_1751 [Synechococcus sp. WH 8101]QNI45574.1 hypothetical protein SynRCC2555_01793 [Synechococcus sp. WH 8101]